MLSDTRIFYTDGRPHIGQSIAQYLGDSRAHWEGEELVVETTNLTDLTAFGVNGNGTRHSKAMKITERFRRVANDIVQYQATWDDPLTYERAFTVSFPLTPLDGGELLPYECHPGNTAISLSLGAERAEDKAYAADLAKGIKRNRRGVQECAASARRYELRMVVIPYVPTVVMCISGKNKRNFQAPLLIQSNPSDVINDSKRFTALHERVQPTRLWTAEDDVCVIRHAFGDCCEIVFLGLIDVMSKLRVHCPHPPIRGQLKSKITSSLVRSPSAEMEVFLPTK